MTSPHDAIPPGFEPAFTESNTFIGLCGPMYVKRGADGTPVLAMRMLPQHLNLRGIVHGGLLATLADSALGYVLNHARRAPLSLVTVNLSIDFAEAAGLGDWVEAHVDVQRLGARMAFANCYLQVGERRILRASGVFAAVKPAGTLPAALA
ncbi:PaaI family thioesterase [Caldimonas brevitalea]|uniref:Phenylacetic acid degradation protein paaI n=1 Tax=Caldimonas brevitalea TaxID=413882 RepID=A0A0G3BLE3_9BURK|nr:PaaI family thioesterase [Caldimonas brevitalea]AKJ30247.1 phenylacetic acid degradation protein paaI [Caldimonas brevitalea]